MNLTIHDAFEIRSNNTWINRSKSTPAPHSLFGEFWRHGELAVLFAHHGLGKSTLAMQIAEQVARGQNSTAVSPAISRPLPSSPPYEGGVAAASADGVVLSQRGEDNPQKSQKARKNVPIESTDFRDFRAFRGHITNSPFPTTASPQTVLYLDLEMTAKQIELRYSRDGENGKLLKNHHRFSERLKRVEVRPELLAGRGERPVDEILYDLIEPLIRETKANVLIVDNIACLRRSAYSTRECVRFMKDLHRLKCLHNLSVLVIAASQKSRTPRPLSVADMQSLRSIAEHADTVFAIGQSSYDNGERYVKHIRTRNAEIVHAEEHVPVFRLKKIARNFLGFEFQRFTEEKTLLRTPPRQADRETMQKILELTEQGLTVRAIADQLEISKSTIHRLRTEAQHWQQHAATKPIAPPSDDSEDVIETESIYDNHEAATERREAYLRMRQSGESSESVESVESVESIECCDPSRSVESISSFKSIRPSNTLNKTNPIAPTDSPDPIDSLDSLDSLDSPDSPDPIDSTDSPPDPILSLPRGFDDIGREIYIEKPGHDGRHNVWYFFDKYGVKTRLERRGYGVFVTKHPDEKRMPP